MRKHSGRGRPSRPGSGAGGKVQGTKKRNSFSLQPPYWLKQEPGSRQCERRAALKEGPENFEGDPSWVEGEKPLTYRPFARKRKR